ncbi:MAG: sulfatase, partial [Pirellulales bacterium]
MPRFSLLRVLIFVVLVSWYGEGFSASPPNILWLSCEDISPHIRCYGDPLATTPNIDRLATQGIRYANAFATAGVCAPCRSVIITGMYQTTLGTHHMRTIAKLPEFVQPFPTYLREAGYYCTNNVKEDYQFRTPKGTWDDSSRDAHWRNRPQPDQPFFAVFNYTGCHESGIREDRKYSEVTEGIEKHDRSKMPQTLPPYYPNTKVTREEWGRNYDVITAMDRWAGELLSQIEEDGLAENTIVFFWSDHGVGLPRAKRWLYDSGMRVPLIVRVPEKYQSLATLPADSVSEQLVSLLDLGPTVLNLAGCEIPSYMQGQPFLGSNLPPQREYVYGARDRMDERYDIIRAVRDHQFKYIRNYETWKPYYQYMNTAEKSRTMHEIRRLHARGELPPASELFMADHKPAEELYDLANDPHEINNLASDPAYLDTLNTLRNAHLDWVRDTRDLGLIPEPELAKREQELSSRYEILRDEDGEALAIRLRDTALLAAGETPQALPILQKRVKDPDAAG